MASITYKDDLITTITYNNRKWNLSKDLSRANPLRIFRLLPYYDRTFSLGPILVDHAGGGAVTIVHSDCDGGDEDGRGGVRRAAKSGGYCAAKATLPIASFARGRARKPEKASDAGSMKATVNLYLLQR